MASEEDDFDLSDEDSTESEDEDKKEDDGDGTKYAVAACLVAAVIILLAIGLFVFLSSSSSKSNKGRVDSDGKKGGAAGGASGNGSTGGAVPVDNLSTLEANDTNATTRKTSSQHYKTTAKPTVQAIKVASTTTTQGPMKREMLLCTVRSNLVPKTPVPEDGLCNIIFYDSIIENTTTNQLGGPYNAAFNYFLMTAQNYTKTENGVGFQSSEKPESSPLAAIANNTDKNIRGWILRLWNKKIYHFGILTMPKMCYQTSCLALHLRVLQTVFNILQDRRSNQRPCYLVFTNLFLDSDTDLGNLKSASDSLAGGTGDNKNSLKLPGHGLVFTSHFTVNDFSANRNCKIVPPLFLESPPNEEPNVNTYFYEWSMNTSHIALKRWADRMYGHQTYFVSAALEGRKYHTNGLNASFLSTCSYDSKPMSMNASLTEVCDSDEYNVTSVKEWGTIARHITLNIAVTYDDAESLRFKFCTLKKKLIGVRYGIIAYSVNTDDTANICHKGKYQRLRTLRWLVDFLNKNFTSQSALDSCIRGQSLPKAENVHT